MTGPGGIEIEEGQIWQEVDPRFTRQVEVMGFAEKEIRVGGKRVSVVLIKRVGAKSQTTAKIERFNGKRGGYILVQSMGATEQGQKGLA